jgi:AraC family ethanolamine operon transcriptional activator
MVSGPSPVAADLPPVHSRPRHRHDADQPAADPLQFITRVRGFRLQLLQLDHGLFVASGSQARFSGGMASSMSLGRAAVQTWTSPARSFTVAVKTTGAIAMWCGVAIQASDILLIGPETEVELVTRAGFGAAAVTFFGSGTRRAAELCGFDASSRKATLIRSQQPLAVDTLRAEIGVMLAQRGAFTPGTNHVDHLLGCVMLALAKSSEVQPHSSSNRRASAIELSLPAIKGRSREPLKIPELCKIAKASERTLRSAFVEHYLLPPARFIKAYRLNQLRQDLAGLAMQEHITEIANNRGFRHLGQLARDYRRWFGELPSATQRRHLRRLAGSRESEARSA